MKVESTLKYTIDFIMAAQCQSFEVILSLGTSPYLKRAALHYLTIQKVTNTRQVRSNDINRLVVPIEKGTFQDTAANLFNNLPDDIKLCKND